MRWSLRMSLSLRLIKVGSWLGGLLCVLLACGAARGAPAEPTLATASKITLPPRPPSAPLGPPLGMNFSLRKLRAPFPPRPALTIILARSMNFMGNTTTRKTEKRRPQADGASLTGRKNQGIDMEADMKTRLKPKRNSRPQVSPDS